MEFFNQYGKVLISILSGIISVMMVMAVFNAQDLGMPLADFSKKSLAQDVNADSARVPYVIPKVAMEVQNDVLEKGQPFVWQDYVTVKIDGVADDAQKQYITVIGQVDTTQTGKEQQITYILNWHGETIEKTATYFVRGV